MNLNELQVGDILVFHNRKDPRGRKNLLTHAAVVVQLLDGVPFIINIYAAGFIREKLFEPKGEQVFSVFRFMQTAVAYGAAALGNLWLHKSPIRDVWSDTSARSSNVYSIPSAIACYLGSSWFGPSARGYASYLRSQCRENPPNDLRPFSGLWSPSGVICSYLPVAIYQAAMERQLTEMYMRLDARRTLPRDLAKYLDRNAGWTFEGDIES